MLAGLSNYLNGKVSFIVIGKTNTKVLVKNHGTLGCTLRLPYVFPNFINKVTNPSPARVLKCAGYIFCDSLFAAMHISKDFEKICKY